MLMRENKGFFSFAYDSAHVKYGIWTWPQRSNYSVKATMIHIKITHCFAHLKLWPLTTEGCSIDPTRVDSSLVFAIRVTGNRFVNPIPSNQHELFPLPLIWHAGSRFAQDLGNIADLDFAGWVENVVDLIKSTRIDSPCVDSTCQKSICVRLRKYSSPGLCMQGGLKMLSIRLDPIESTRIVSAVIDSSCQKSICMRRETVRIESSHKVRCMNRLKFVATF